MDKLCNNLLETYNTNYLNMEDDEIQLKFEKESKKNKDGNKGHALLQLSSSQDACLVDLIGLKNNLKLDDALTRLFNCPMTVLIGFAFHSDLTMFKQHLPHMKFYQNIANLCDV